MLIRSPFHYIFQEHWYNLTDIPKFVKVGTYANSYNYVANNVRRLIHTCFHLIPKLDETPEYTINVILTPTSLFHHVFLFFYIYLTRTSKLFQPVHLPTPNCNQRLTPFHCLSSSWQKKHIPGKPSTPYCTNLQFGSHKYFMYCAGQPFLFPLFHCENIHSWISLSGDLAFSHQDGIYGFDFPKKFLEISSWDLTLFSILII